MYDMSDLAKDQAVVDTLCDGSLAYSQGCVAAHKSQELGWSIYRSQHVGDGYMGSALIFLVGAFVGMIFMVFRLKQQRAVPPSPSQGTPSLVTTRR